RKHWFETLTDDAKAALTADEKHEVVRHYQLLGGYVKLSDLLDGNIKKLLDVARNEPTKREESAGCASVLLEEAFRNELDRSSTQQGTVPPHYFVVLAALCVLRGKNEAALAVLYHAHDEFPDTLVTNASLFGYLIELSDDYYTALNYGDGALDAVRQMQVQRKESYRLCRRALVDGQSQFEEYLRAEVQKYRLGTNSRL